MTSRRDIAAMTLALHVLRDSVDTDGESGAWWRARLAEAGIRSALKALGMGTDVALEGAVAVWMGPRPAKHTRILRARLALYLRAVLRMEAAEAWEASDWTGTPPPSWTMVCDQCGSIRLGRDEEPGLCRPNQAAPYVQAAWRHPRPLWLDAPPHKETP
jgi:hypothetical protein